MNRTFATFEEAKVNQPPTLHGHTLWLEFDDRAGAWRYVWRRMRAVDYEEDVAQTEPDASPGCAVAQDTFRSTYRELPPTQSADINNLKHTAAELEDLITRYRTGESSRAAALALTRLEEAVMWATKAVTA